MADTGAARARLRRTFRYPDDDSDAEPEAMDEQEQESLIERLSAENTARNAQFTTLLLALPVVAALPYLPLLVQPRSSLVALLSITSLLSTALLLHRLPPTVTGIAPLDAWTRSEDMAAAAKEASDLLRRRRRGAGALAGSSARVGPPLDPGRSPLEMYLPYLNVGLSLVLVLMGLATGRGTGSFSLIGVGNLPAIVYGVVLLAKVVMGSVDPEKELSALRYQYKGA